MSTQFEIQIKREKGRSVTGHHTPNTHVVEQENIYVDFPVSFLTLHDVLSLGQDVKIDHLVGEFLICKVSFVLLFLYCDLKFEVKFFIHNYCY